MMDKCVYPECEYYGLKDRTMYHKCEVHKKMCDITLDGKHICKSLYYGNGTEFQLYHYCKDHNQQRCYWETYYGTQCDNIEVDAGLCVEHTCIEKDCNGSVEPTEAESYLVNDGYCKKHYVGDRVKNAYDDY